MLAKGNHVQVTKVDSITDVEPSNSRDLNPASPYEQHGVNTGYQVRGEIAREPVLGRGFSLLRSERNGIGAVGFFNTSPIVKIHSTGSDDKYFLSTANSIYLVEILDDSINNSDSGT